MHSGGFEKAAEDDADGVNLSARTYDAANRISSTSADTTTWTYDAAGNQTRNGITGQTMTQNSRGAVTGIDSTSYTGFGPGNTNQLTRSGGTACGTGAVAATITPPTTKAASSESSTPPGLGKAATRTAPTVKNAPSPTTR